MRRSVVVLCALTAALCGCARGDDVGEPTPTVEPRLTESSPSPKAQSEDQQGCSLLTSKERRSIAGERLDAVPPSQPVEGTLACRWVRSLSAPSPTSLSVEARRADQWVLGLPQQIDAAVASGRSERKFTKRLLAAKKRVLERADEIGGREACRMFSLLVEINGGKKGAPQLVLFLPAESGAVTTTAQRCTNGVHTLLIYKEMGLQPSFPLIEAGRRLVKVAHGRAIKLL